jgi:hypothetical protein
VVKAKRPTRTKARKVARRPAPAKRQAVVKRPPAPTRPKRAKAQPAAPVASAVRRLLPPRKAPPVHPATLERARRVLSDAEREPQAPAVDARMLSSARAGHNELDAMLRRHTETSPALTAGDLDAKWEDAYAQGDESPGGDNPTPDQNRVDLIGKALGTEYADDQELQGGEEIVGRDRHRWELDPASSEDWPHDSKKK